MMFKRVDKRTEELRCSFCRKSQDAVEKLISNPSDDPKRVYICDECVTVCASILEDDRGVGHPTVLTTESSEPHPLLSHPLTPQLLAAIDRWIKEESLGADASEEFAEVRAIALRLMLPSGTSHPPK